MSDTMEWRGSTSVYGAGVEGEEHRKAQIHRSGDDYVLYAPDAERRMRRVDRVTNAKLTDENGIVTIVGTSQELVDEVGVRPEESQVRWVMKVRGCQGCS